MLPRVLAVPTVARAAPAEAQESYPELPCATLERSTVKGHLKLSTASAQLIQAGNMHGKRSASLTSSHKTLLPLQQRINHIGQLSHR